MTQKQSLLEEILQRAEASRQAHLEAGLYTLEDEARVAAAALKLPSQESSILRKLEEVQTKVNQSYDPTGLPEIISHRPLVGRMIVAGKRLMYQLTRPYINMILNRQALHNLHVVELLNETVEANRQALEGLTLTNQRLNQMFDQLDEISQRQARLTRRLDVAGPAALAAAAAPPETGLSALDYAAFEDRHRGREEEIKAKQAPYVDLFRNAPGPVLDLGCGRGEFLELLAAAGVEAYGVDLNADMIQEVRDKGLKALLADGAAHLKSLTDGSLGGLFMAQVIEHLSLSQLTALLEEAFRVLAPGGAAVAETINPQSLSTFAGAFYVDLTHVRPVHPEGARFLWEIVGFKNVRIVAANPYAEKDRLQPVDPSLPGAKVINDNFRRLNGLLYAPQDFAVVGVR